MTHPTAPQGAPRYCRHCHLAIPSKARVCGHCGRDPDRERTFEPGTVPTIACGTVLGACLLIQYTRHLGDGRYRIDTHVDAQNAFGAMLRHRVLVAGMQPEAALGLLAEAPYGTPQRFLWCSVVDPTIPDDPPPWPGELRVRALEHFRELTIDPDVCAELRRQDLARQRGELRRDPLDAHEPLVRVKVAAILALLDDRTDIGPGDWGLAGVVWETSCAVRSAVAAYGRALEARRERDQLRVHARRAVAADRAVERERANVERVAATLRRAVLRAGAPLSNRDLHHAVRRPQPLPAVS